MLSTSDIKSQVKIDRNQMFKEIINKISLSLSKNDVSSIGIYFEKPVFENFKLIYQTKESKKYAANMLKGQVTSSKPTQKMIFGEGFQISFIFKTDKWIITSWDVFSSD